MKRDLDPGECHCQYRSQNPPLFPTKAPFGGAALWCGQCWTIFEVQCG